MIPNPTTVQYRYQLSFPERVVYVWFNNPLHKGDTIWVENKGYAIVDVVHEIRDNENGYGYFHLITIVYLLKVEDEEAYS